MVTKRIKTGISKRYIVKKRVPYIFVQIAGKKKVEFIFYITGRGENV